MDNARVKVTCHQLHGVSTAVLACIWALCIAAHLIIVAIRHTQDVQVTMDVVIPFTHGNVRLSMDNGDWVIDNEARKQIIIQESLRWLYEDVAPKHKLYLEATRDRRKRNLPVPTFVDPPRTFQLLKWWSFRLRSWTALTIEGMLIVPLVVLHRLTQRRSRIPDGCCPQCGYDWRYNRDHCSECGHGK